MTKMGSKSVNGFVYLINYKQDDYNFSAVLKSSAKPNADNLFYEYFVGKNFINKMNLIFPCFVETYRLYVNNNEELYNKMRRLEIMESGQVESSLVK